MSPPACPRCGGPLRAPDLMDSSWRCERDGAVDPLHVAAPVRLAALRTVAEHSAVPVWLPLPPPVGWTLTGLAHAGDERTGARAAAVAMTGPSPLGGPADLVVLAEEPGVGLGARYAGLPGLDAGTCVDGPPYARVEALGHPVALWACAEAPADRAVFVGEAEARWLWLVLWPAAAGTLLLEHLLLIDVRERPVDVLLGAASTRLA